MPRVRIGLTGLACVFLLVLFAAALFGTQRPATRPVPEEPLAELGVSPGRPGMRANRPIAAPPHEPLAELGVTPGGSSSGKAAARRRAADAGAPVSGRDR